MTAAVALQANTAPAELVKRAVALQPLLRKHACDGDLRRRESDEVIDALTDAGFFRLRTPRRFGGYAVDTRTIFDLTAALGEADGSAAWLVGISATQAWLSGHVSEQAQREIYRCGPDVRFAGNLSPLPSRKVDGGVVVSGRWPFASGASHAEWAALGVMVTDDADKPSQPYWCVIPAAELKLEDTWRTVGMRGTGSNTWNADEVFVPAHRL